MSDTDADEPMAIIPEASKAVTGNIIEVIVGKSRTRSYIDSLESNSKPGEKIQIDAFTEEEEIFNIFVDWMYTFTLPHDPEDWLRRFRSQAPPPITHANLLMIKTYHFSKAFKIPKLCNDISRKITNQGSEQYVPTHDVIKYAFNYLPEESPILDFLADSYYMYGDINAENTDEQVRKMGKDVPTEFYMRLRDRFSRSQTTRRGVMNPPDYYENEGKTGEKERGDAMQES